MTIFPSRADRGRNSVLRVLMAAGLLAAGLAGWAPQSFAVGLGEIDVQSSLNERFSALIPLRDASGLSEEEVRVTLASADEFERIGVERFFFLNGLKFSVVMQGGRPVVQVSSDLVINEPFLNFVVSVRWPQGRLLKEFTVLLDPPTYTEVAAPPVSAPAARSDSSPAPETVVAVPLRGTVVRTDAPATSTSAPANDWGDPGAAPAGGEYRMRPYGETLWKIANELSPSSEFTVQQTMLAIQRLNPDAFIGGNINRLKGGMTLRVPTADEVAALTASEAMEQFARQDRQWRGVEPSSDAIAEPLATARPAIDATPVRDDYARLPESDGELKIVAGQGDETARTTAAQEAEPQSEPASAATTPTGADPELAAALEERDRLSLELRDVNGQLTQQKRLIADQIAVKDRQIEVRDQQIAAMQAELERLRAGAGADTTDTTDTKQDQSAPRRNTPWWQAPEVLGTGAGVVILLLAVVLLIARRRSAGAGRTSKDARDLEPRLEVAAASGAVGGSSALASPPRSPATVDLLEVEELPGAVRPDSTTAESAPVAERSVAAVAQEMLEIDDLEIDLPATASDTADIDATTQIGASTQVHAAPEAAGLTGEFELELDLIEDLPAGPAAERLPEDFASAGTEGEIELEVVSETTLLPDTGLLSAAAGSDENEIRGVADLEFRFEEEDLEGLDDAELALEMDGEPATEDDFDFVEEGDSASTKLDLAKAYAELGDADGAREILLEVVKEGSEAQRQAAQDLLDQL